MPLFCLKHPSLDFKGVAGGVDFSNGRGTTSSLSYAQGLVKTLQCKAFIFIDGQEKEIEILEELNKGGTTVLSYRVFEKKETKEGAAVLAPAWSPPAEKFEAVKKKRSRKK